MAGCQRGGVACWKKPKPPPDGCCCVRDKDYLSISLSFSLAALSSLPLQERRLHLGLQGLVFPRFRAHRARSPTLLKKFLLKAPICICALCMQRGQISFLTLRVVLLHALDASARSHAEKIFKSLGGGGGEFKAQCAHNAVSHFTPDSALNAGRLSACKHAVNSI